MKNLLFVFILLFGAGAFSQEMNPSDFVIDPLKPYVYLEFDHIGPRKPLQDGEGNTGLWLRVVNNCRIPIVFLGSDPSRGEPGVSLMDEVVEDEPIMQIISSDQQMKDYERDQKLRKERLKHKPQGYSSETPGIITVQSGKEILFSVPIEHISDYWYMRVKFAFKLNRSSQGVGPFTYLPFYKWDIPKNERTGNPTPSKALTQ